MKSLRLLTLTLVTLGLTACGDSLPEGPGPVEAVLETGSLEIGAAVIQLNGTGIGAVEGLSGTRAIAAEEPSSSKRVVLVTGSAGDLRFTIDVEDRSLPLPTATIVEAIDLENQTIAGLSEARVRISLPEGAQ